MAAFHSFVSTVWLRAAAVHGSFSRLCLNSQAKGCCRSWQLFTVLSQQSRQGLLPFMAAFHSFVSTVESRAAAVNDSFFTVLSQQLSHRLLLLMAVFYNSPNNQRKLHQLTSIQSGIKNFPYMFSKPTWSVKITDRKKKPSTTTHKQLVS